MALTVSTAWKEAMSQSGVTPQFLVDLEIGPVAYLTVLDWTAGTGVKVIYSATGHATDPDVYVEYVEGVDFTAATSNDATAASIKAAVGSAVRGSTVFFYARGYETLSVTSSNDTAWTGTPAAVPRMLSMCSGAEVREGYRNILANVSPIGQTIDPVGRVFSLGDVELTIVDDGTFRDIAKRTRLRGKKVTIRLGSPELDEADFAPVGVLYIDEVIPQEGSITIHCLDPVTMLRDRKFRGQFVNIHPLSAIKTVLEETYNLSDIVDATTLDSTAYPTISHWSVHRSDAAFGYHGLVSPAAPFVYNGIGEDDAADALELVGELLMLLDGTFVVDEEGMYHFGRYDSTVSPVRAFTEEEIDAFEQTTTCANMTTAVIVNGAAPPGQTESANLRPWLVYVADDVAEEIHGSVEVLNRQIESTINTEWLGAPAFALKRPTASDLDLFVEFATVAGHSGARVSANAPATTQRAADTLSSTRTAYLLITDGEQSEIVEAEDYTIITDRSIVIAGGSASAPIDNVRVGPMFTDPEITLNRVAGAYSFWRWGYYTIKSGGRGALGTSPIDWTQGAGAAVYEFARRIRVYDVTVAAAMAQARVSRFGVGCPIVKIRVPLHHWDLQLADFVTIEHDLYFGFQKDGADTSTVFEIVSKELALDEDSPAVVLTLAWVRDDVTHVFTPTWSPPAPIPIGPATLLEPMVDDDGDLIVTDDEALIYGG